MSEYFLKLVDTRKTNDVQLWVAGCSFAHGSRIKASQRFGVLLANKLQVPVSFLTHPGSSVSWAADQILRSDLQADDIVVWAVTGASRIALVDELNNINHITATNFDQQPVAKLYLSNKLLVSNHMIYDAINHMQQVQNFCKKIRAKLILCLMPCNIAEHNIIIENYISTLENGIILYDPVIPNVFEDYGSDNLHPGPKQNEIYYNEILNKYENLCSFYHNR